MSLIHNERTKLSATALNGTAIASIAAGFITPFAAVSFGVPGAGTRGTVATTLFAFAWLAVGGIRHVTARSFAREPPGMSGSDLYLLALGPVLALVAGLFIFLTATLGLSNSGGKPAGQGRGERR